MLRLVKLGPRLLESEAFKPKACQMRHKHGDIRLDDGMLFWAYRTDGSERWVSKDKFASLRAVANENAKKRYHKDIEKSRAALRKWHHENKEKKHAAFRAWAAKNKHRIRATVAARKAANPVL